MMPNTKLNKFVLLVFVLLVVGALVIFRDDVSRFVKNNFENKNFNGVLSILKDQASLPGKLVAKVESSKAYLTNGGVFAFTNKERAKAGLGLFKSNLSLGIVAKKRLEDMFAKGYFEHVSPTGESASTVADFAGYEYISIGENIALGNFENDEALVSAWMASPGHRANILNSKFTELGIAVGKGIYEGKSTWIGVQIFARPISSCPQIDSILKNKIEIEENEIASLKEKLEQIESELSAFRNDRRGNREEYNRKVDEYNSIADQINAIIPKLKADIASYNLQVEAFNSCIKN